MAGGTFIGNNGPNSLTGTAQKDLIRGRGGNDVLRGLGDSDRIFGDNGDDLLFGGNGEDRLSGGNGDDRLSGGGGGDRLSGGDGDDRLSGGNGDDRLSGGDGDDRLSGGNGNDRLSGGADNDRLSGGNGDDRLAGGLGNDTVSGSAGADTINGGVGNDLLRPGADLAADAVNGGDGIDTVDYSNATGGVIVDLRADGLVAGAAAGDTYALVESVIGSNFADTLTARDGGTASGGGGDDILNGAGFGTTTILVGGAGTDTLSGGSFGQELMQLELNNGPDTFNGVFRTTDADRLLVDNAVFNVGLGVTPNEIVNLPTGPALANSAIAQFIYIAATNEVFFDQDGTGGAFAPVLLATVNFVGPDQLLATDLLVI